MIVSDMEYIFKIEDILNENVFDETQANTTFCNRGCKSRFK